MVCVGGRWLAQIHHPLPLNISICCQKQSPWIWIVLWSLTWSLSAGRSTLLCTEGASIMASFSPLTPAGKIWLVWLVWERGGWRNRRPASQYWARGSCSAVNSHYNVQASKNKWLILGTVDRNMCFRQLTGIFHGNGVFDISRGRRNV